MLTNRFAQLIARLAFAMAVFATAVAALTPPADHPLHIAPFQKGDHVIAFFALGLLGALAAPRIPLAVLAGALAFFGASIEVLQALPEVARDPRATDVLIDLGAAIVAIAPMGLLRRSALARSRVAGG